MGSLSSVACSQNPPQHLFVYAPNIMLDGLCDLKLAKELFNLLNIFGKGSRSEGEEKGQERYTTH